MIDDDRLTLSAIDNSVESWRRVMSEQAMPIDWYSMLIMVVDRCDVLVRETSCRSSPSSFFSYMLVANDVHEE